MILSRNYGKSGIENFVLFFVFQALLITFNKSSNVCAAVLFPNFQLLEIKNGSRWHHFAGPKWKTKEIVARRPSKADKCEDIAQFLSSLFSIENNRVVLKGRGCRERSEPLISKFKSEECKALKR